MVGEAAEAASTRLVRHLGTVDQGAKGRSSREGGSWWVDGGPSRWEGEGKDTADLEAWLDQRRKLAEASREDQVTSTQVDLTSLGPVPVQYYLVEDHLILGISLMSSPSPIPSFPPLTPPSPGSLRLRVVTRDVSGKSVWKLVKTLGIPSSALRSKTLSTMEEEEDDGYQGEASNEVQEALRKSSPKPPSTSTFDVLFQDVGAQDTHPDLSFPPPDLTSQAYYELLYPAKEEKNIQEEKSQDKNDESARNAEEGKVASMIK